MGAHFAGAAVFVGAVRRMPKAPCVAALNGSGISKGSAPRKASQGFRVSSGLETMRDLPPPRAATQGA